MASAEERAKLNPLAALGHTFFIGVTDENGLQRLWNHQLRFVFEKAFRLDPEGLAEIHRSWNAIVLPPVVPAATASAASDASAGDGAAPVPPRAPAVPSAES
jgi:hypothetical protein